MQFFSIMRFVKYIQPHLLIRNDFQEVLIYFPIHYKSLQTIFFCVFLLELWKNQSAS